MPTIEDIESFKKYVKTLGKEQEIRRQLGLPEQDIKPPESNLPDDLADLLGGMPSMEAPETFKSEDDLLSGLFTDPSQDSDETDLPNLDDLLGVASENPPSDEESLDNFLDNLGGETYDESPPPADDFEPAEGLGSEPVDEINDEINDELGPEDDLGALEDLDSVEDFDSPEELGSLDTLDDASSMDDFDTLDDLTPMSDDFDAANAADPEELFPSGGDGDIQFDSSAMNLSGDTQDDEDTGAGSINLDDSYLDDEFSGLMGAASHEEIDAFDPENLGDEFALGDFGSQFGVDINEKLDQDSLNPAMAVEKEIAQAQKAIAVSDEDFLTLQRNLSLYPLNLKLAIEEALGEKELAYDEVQKILRQLIQGLGAKGMALLVGKALGKAIRIPPGYEKGTGEGLEERQGSLAYNLAITVIPILRNSVVLSGVAALLTLLGWYYLYVPVRADQNYSAGLAAVLDLNSPEGERYFQLGWGDWPSEEWAFRYASAYKDLGQYDGAREKFRLLLNPATDGRTYSLSYGQEIFTTFHRKALLEYAELESLFGFNGLEPTAHFEKADALLGLVLNENMYDRQALLARGDNAMRWAEKDSRKLLDANKAFSVYLQRYGYDGPVTYRFLQHFMMKNDSVSVEETLRLKNMILATKSIPSDAEVLSQLGGWLMDQHERVIFEQDKPKARLVSLEEEYGAVIPPDPAQAGGPDYYTDVREILLKALEADSQLPDVHYQLARMFRLSTNKSEEEKALAAADTYFRNFPASRMGQFGRIGSRVDTLGRMAEVFKGRQETLQSEKYYLEAVRLYENALATGRLEPKASLARFYEGLGDIYYDESRNWTEALRLYQKAQDNYHTQPNLTFKMGVIHYAQKDYKRAVEHFYEVEKQPGLRNHPNVLFTMANSLYRSGNYFGAVGYYEELLVDLQTKRRDAIELIPNLDPTQKDLLENIYKTMNNLALALYRGPAAEREDSPHFGRSFALLTEAEILYQDMNRNIENLTRTEKEERLSLNVRDIQFPSREVNLDIYDALPLTLQDPSF